MLSFHAPVFVTPPRSIDGRAQDTASTTGFGDRGEVRKHYSTQPFMSGISLEKILK